MSIRLKLLVSILICAIGFVVSGGLALTTIEAVKINGDAYQRIVQGKDLIADILPPPAFIVETFLTACQIVESKDSSQQNAIDKERQLRSEYYQRHEHWKRTLPDSVMKGTLIDTAHRPAEQFFDILEQELIPLARKQDRETARRLLQEKLLPLYITHKEAIETVVKFSTTELSTAEAAAAATLSFRKTTLWTLGLVFLSLIIGVAVFVSRITGGIVSRASEAKAYALAMAKGDMTRSLSAGTNDEMGQLIHALNDMGAGMRSMITEINGSVRTLFTSSKSLLEVAGIMEIGVQNINAKSESVAAAAEESSATTQSVATNLKTATENLGTVVSSTEEMSQTIAEIASNTAKAREISSAANRQADEVTSFMNELNQAAQEIGQVTETITRISAQTNLLALNATIEAARAGSLGRGFAVVANEIKELAQQTAGATEDIHNRIHGIQNSSSKAIDSLGRITGVISQVGEIVTTISAAVEEQSSVSKGVAANITHASEGVATSNEHVAQSATVSGSIASDIGRISSTIQEIHQSGKKVRDSATELAAIAGQLNSTMQKFKV